MRSSVQCSYAIANRFSSWEPVNRSIAVIEDHREVHFSRFVREETWYDNGMAAMAERIRIPNPEGVVQWALVIGI
jgi:hypothetical protein